MSSLKALGIIGTGGLGVLAAGLIISKMLNTGLDWIFGLALVIFVIAGAIALIARSVK
ncbi:hypothetical protein HYW99_03075 [Candidatus Woesearchaeota archaeon]|nr:hypothetical protein [Candidatus Woesearchaeota archaeon]